MSLSLLRAWSVTVVSHRYGFWEAGCYGGTLAKMSNLHQHTPSYLQQFQSSPRPYASWPRKKETNSICCKGCKEPLRESSSRNHPPQENQGSKQWASNHDPPMHMALGNHPFQDTWIQNTHTHYTWWIFQPAMLVYKALALVFPMLGGLWRGGVFFRGVVSGGQPFAQKVWAMKAETHYQVLKSLVDHDFDGFWILYLKMDGWNTSFLLGWLIFRCEVLVSGSVHLPCFPFRWDSYSPLLGISTQLVFEIITGFEQSSHDLVWDF